MTSNILSTLNLFKEVDKHFLESIELIYIYKYISDESAIMVTIQDNVYTIGTTKISNSSGDIQKMSQPEKIHCLCGKKVRLIEMNKLNVLVLTGDGQVFMWGDNSFGQLGNGNFKEYKTPIQVLGLAGKTVIDIKNGYDHILALTDDGFVYCWGANDFGQSGCDTNRRVKQPTPVKVDGLIAQKSIIKIAAGPYRCMVLTSLGEVFSWGYNAYGQLGDGTNVSRSTPVKTLLESKKIIEISCGTWHSMALDSQGRVYAWGYNGEGQIGNGTTNAQLIPVQVKCAYKVIDIACSESFSAMQALNTVYVWGALNDKYLVPTKVEFECIDEMCISLCKYTCRMYRPRAEKKLEQVMYNLLKSVSRKHFWDVYVLFECTVEPKAL